MLDKKTSDIDNLINNITPDQIDSFYQENGKHMASDDKAFYYFMKDTIEAKNILLKDIYMQADVTESYGEKIIRMEKHTKNRDLIIRLCLAGHFSLIETNRALKLYGMSPLYSKNKRDALIIVLINNRVFRIHDVNDNLQKHNLDPLTSQQ